MIKLKKGDIVDIVAPAGFSDPQVLIKAVDELKKWGLIPRTNIDFEAFHPFHSDDDKNRFDDLKLAINNSDSKVIWSLRGGYGSARLLNDLSKLKRPKNKKILIGYSDITALHSFVANKWGWESVHGPLISSFSSKDFDKACLLELKNILFGKLKLQKIEIGGLNESAEVNKTKISGKLVGGNLAVLQTLIGTKYAMKAKDKIVVLEDINEKGYQIDRILNHLNMSGAFKGAKAIIFGDFIGGSENNGESFVDFSIMRFALDFKIPIYTCADFGHGNKNRPLVLNQNYTIEKNFLKTTNK